MRTDPPGAFTLIIRLWQEKNGGALIWRGSVNHVQSGERVYFQNVAHLVDMISCAMKGLSMQESAEPSSRNDENLDQN